MLKHTLILPSDDAPLAAELLQDAIDALDTILMLVPGKDDQAGIIVGWADKLCNKTQMTPTYNPRKVVWIRKPDVNPVREILDPILGEGVLPRVAVLNFYDKLKATLNEGDLIDPVALELAFLEGGKEDREV